MASLAVTRTVGVARAGNPVKAVALPMRSRRALQAKALLGPDGRPSGSTTTSQKKKFITREEEPEQYWSSKGEQAGSNPMADPLAIIGVGAIFFPFVLLGIAAAAGLVDFSVYR